MRTATISIPQPCQQSWAAMTPTAAGRHCASCQKTVVDFTRKTAEEILAYLAQPGHEKVCGRFGARQLNPPTRLLSWRAAPRLALSVATILALTHCTVDTLAPLPPNQAITPAQSIQLVRGRVLDRDTRQPLPQALIICEADTLCQTRTAADGSFALAVPVHLQGSRLIAAVTKFSSQAQLEEEDLLPFYIPHYFTANDNATVLLRRPPMILGQTKLEPGETRSSAIQPYLQKCAALPPPPVLTTIEFTPPREKQRH